MNRATFPGRAGPPDPGLVCLRPPTGGQAMNRSDLEHVAAAMVAADKGLLAADESSATIKKRFDKIGLESTAESRQAYRNLLFTTPGAQAWISGVILYDETLRQKTLSGVPFPEYLKSLGIIPGIKVDMGA